VGGGVDRWVGATDLGNQKNLSEVFSRVFEVTTAFALITTIRLAMKVLGISETHPTIDQQLCTDRKRCLIRSEKHDSIRDLTWLSEPSSWDLLDERSLLLL